MLISLDQVTVDYGSGASAFRAVHETNLAVTEGVVLGLVGESGSGKSTLGRAIAGLEPISGGTIDRSGLPVSPGPSPVQYIFQDASSALNPRMPVGRSIAEGLTPKGRLDRHMRARVAQLLELVHLDASVESKRPAQLSGGQRQRVAIARALAVEPAVLVADEITSALDASVQSAVLNLLWELKRETRLAMVFISHDISVVNYIADEIAVMKNGTIVEQAPADAVIRNPKNEYTRTLLGSVPTLPTSDQTMEDQRNRYA